MFRGFRFVSPMIAVCALCWSVPAAAVDVSVGLNAALAIDLPDPVSSEYTKFGPGPSLQVPVRFMFSDLVGVRVTPRADFAAGQDRVSWVQNVDGDPVRFYDDDHKAFLVTSGVTVGPEVVVPLSGMFAPYFGAEAGIAFVGTYHVLGGDYTDSQILLDPAQNELDNPRNIDPFTSQAAFLTDLHAGGRFALNEVLNVFVELGYSGSYVAERPLQKTAAELDARREAYGWNAFRGGVGVAFSL